MELISWRVTVELLPISLVDGMFKNNIGKGNGNKIVEGGTSK